MSSSSSDQFSPETKGALAVDGGDLDLFVQSQATFFELFLLRRRRQPISAIGDVRLVYVRRWGEMLRCRWRTQTGRQARGSFYLQLPGDLKREVHRRGALVHHEARKGAVLLLLV